MQSLLSMLITALSGQKHRMIKSENIVLLSTSLNKKSYNFPLHRECSKKTSQFLRFQCTLEKKTVKKVNPETSCRKVSNNRFSDHKQNGMSVRVIFSNPLTWDDVFQLLYLRYQGTFAPRPTVFSRTPKRWISPNTNTILSDWKWRSRICPGLPRRGTPACAEHPRGGVRPRTQGGL